MTSTQTLQGKVAFIQGGSRGIGAAIVKRLAAEGAAVAFTYVSSAERANALALALAARPSLSRPTVSTQQLCNRLFALRSSTSAAWTSWLTTPVYWPGVVPKS